MEWYSYVSMSRDQKVWRNQAATGWILAMHGYSIWVKNVNASALPEFVLPGRPSAEAQVIWGGIVKCPLIAYFIGNISAKRY